MRGILQRFRSSQTHIPALAVAVVIALAPAASALAQQVAPAPVQQAATTAESAAKPLMLEDYPRWSRIGSAELSPDGRWMAYTYEPLEGDGTLYVRDLDSEMLHEIERGTDAEFSDDSAWIAYMVELPEDEREKLERAREPVTRQAEILELASGERFTTEDADRFAFSADSGFFAVKKRKADRDAEHEGTDLALRNLSGSAVINIGNVAEFAFNEAGSLLAYTVDAAARSGNGVYVMNPRAGRLVALDTGDQRYAQLTWHESGTALATLRGSKAEDSAQRDNVLLAFRGLDANDPDSGAGAAGSPNADAYDGSPSALAELSGTRVGGAVSGGTFVYDPAADAAFPEGMVLSELGELEWSESGSRVFLGIKEQEAEQEDEDEDGEAKADVDVWHYKDAPVQSVQMRRASRDRRFTYRSVIQLDFGRFVRLADDEMDGIQVRADARFAVGRDGTPYQYEISWGGSRADTYRVDVETGERELLIESLGRPMGASPDGRWYLYLENERLRVMELASGAITDLTELSGIDFVDHTDDHPYELPTYGIAGWSKDGGWLLVNHRFDIWALPLPATEDTEPAAGASNVVGGIACASACSQSDAAANDSQPINLTRGVGEREQIRFRYVDLERAPGRFGFGGGGGDDEGIDISQPLLLSAYGERTKKSGYYRLEWGSEPEPLIFEDMSIGSLRKADDADRLIFTRQSFVEFPDYWLAESLSAPGFAAARKITDANPQQAEYAWSPGRVLIDYTDDRGNELQATLGLPAGYQQGQRYPMLVYFYEKMSQRHHQYEMPRYDDRPHMSTYASNGYLVLQPDVVYTPGEPGSSALDDVGSAVRKVIELGYADPDRVCVQGHSWGGYQTSFLVTATDLFACVVTGAPVTNLVSFYNELYKSSGNPQQGITEVGQVRMGVSPWDDWELYKSQSPVHRVQNITTPFLILHGTDDGSVDWHQGLEFFNAARRWGKEVILLSYPGEGHHLSRKENQIDFQIRMRQFFDHYMKGTPKPPWMEEGVPFLKKGGGVYPDGVGGR